MGFKKILFCCALSLFSSVSINLGIFALTDEQNNKLKNIGCELEQTYSSGIKIKNVVSNCETGDYLNVACGDLWGSKGGVGYLCDGSSYDVAPTQPDEYVHFTLFKANENSVFSGTDKVWLEVVRQDDGGLVFSAPCEFKSFDDLSLKEKYFPCEEIERYAKDKEYCYAVLRKGEEFVRNKFSSALEISLDYFEDKSELLKDGIYVGNFLTDEELDLFKKGGREIKKSVGKDFTFKFYKVFEKNCVDSEGGSFVDVQLDLIATADYKFEF